LSATGNACFFMNHLKGPAMLKPYDLVEKCQKKILNCELPTVDRLQLEMCLLSTKMALLDQDVDMTNSEKEIKDIYDQICNLCSRDSKPKDIKSIVTRLQRVAEGR